MPLFLGKYTDDPRLLISGTDTLKRSNVFNLLDQNPGDPKSPISGTHSKRTNASTFR